MAAGTIGDVQEELFEDQFLKVVLGAEDDPSGFVNGLAVGEGRARGQHEEIAGAQLRKVAERSLVVGIKMDGGAELVAEGREGGGELVVRGTVAAFEEFVDVVRGGAGCSFDNRRQTCQFLSPAGKPQKLDMRAFLVTLLMAISVGLCGLITYQWLREVESRHKVQGLTDELQNKKEAIQNLTGVLKRSEDEVNRLEEVKKTLTTTVKTNLADLARLEKDLDKAQAETERQQKQVEVYRDALKQANENIQSQNNTISQQNEELKKLAEDRNGIVLKLNKTVEEYNGLVDKWNALQNQLAAAATNAPAKK